MSTISHVWPGYTLLNVWTLSFKAWAFLRANAEEYDRQARAASR